MADWIVRLDRLAEGPLALSGALPGDAGFWSAPGLRLAAGPELGLTAAAAPGGAVRVHGFLRVTVELECRRCLRELPTALALALDLRFQPGLSPAERDEGVFELPAGATELDLRESLREELLLAVPLFPLCREECAGLCPRCGTDLNEGACGCPPREPDPRWAALREHLAGD